MKKIKPLLIAFLMGVCMGSLMAISIKYPVKVASIEEATKLCAGDKNLGLEKLKVGLSGKMYYVQCKSRKVFEFK